MMRQHHIIVCDDDAALRQMLDEHLTDCGYLVVQAADANVLKSLLESECPDLIILDVRMPETDGLSALRDIRVKSNIPIMMLTAAGDVLDRVLGFEFGADDYLVKPVDLREFQARVKAVIRRSEIRKEQIAEKQKLTGTVPFGTCRLNLDNATLFGADGNEIAITAMEFNLMKVLVENKGRILNRSQLLDFAHDKDKEPFDRSIDLRISRVRRKVEVNPSKPEVIRTIHGIGYIFD